MTTNKKYISSGIRAA